MGAAVKEHGVHKFQVDGKAQTMARARPCIVLLSLCLGCLTVPTAAWGQEKKSISFETIVAKWREQQQRIKTLDIFCKVSHRGADGKAIIGVPSGQTLETAIRYVRSEGMYRLERKILEWNNPLAAVFHFDYVHVSSKDYFKEYIGKRSTAGHAVLLVHRGGTESDSMSDLFNRALPLALATSVADYVDMFTTEAGSVTIEHVAGDIGRGDIVVLHGFRGWSVWVDAKTGYLPFQVGILKEDGAIHWIVKLQYQLNEHKEWIVKSWTLFGLNYSEDAEVVYCKINDKLPADVFDMQPPPNTYVNNFLTREEYIQRATGKRPLWPGEYKGDNFEELLASEQGPPPPVAAEPADTDTSIVDTVLSGQWPWWVGGISLVLFMVAVIGFVVQGWRVQRSPK